MTASDRGRGGTQPPEPRSQWLADLAWYRGRSVFLTGHTGFKGSWLALWLHHLGAQVTGYALDPPTSPSHFVEAGVAQVLAADHRADIRDRERLEAAIRDARPEVVFHLAAQSVVLDGYADPVETFSVNVVGSAIVLEAVRTVGRPCAVVVVTSDKCYANDESGRSFEEGDPLGGHDPYSASKAGTELVAAAYRHSYFPPAGLANHGIGLATARAGNVIGGGDWTANGVVADVFRALDAGVPVALRRPEAIRPWQHVLEPLGGYLLLAARLASTGGERYCDAWNFGPEPADEATVQELVERILAGWGSGTWTRTGNTDDPPEAGVLRLSIARAQRELGWCPRWRLSTAVDRTVSWHRSRVTDRTATAAASLADITAYMAAP